MKIAYLSTFYPYRGGIAQFNAALYREFEKQHEIRAYTFKRQYPDLLFPGKSQYVSPDDPADKIPAERILDTINPLTYLSAGRKMAKFAPDILLTKFWMPFFAPSLGKSASALKKCGTVRLAVLDNVIPHEKRPGDTALIKYFLKNYDGFITMSKAVENDLLSVCPSARYLSRPHPLYDAFGSKEDKAEARAKLGVPPDSKTLLFYGFIRDYKGLDILLQAMKSLPENYFLLVAGEPYGDFSKYEKMIDCLGIRHRVRTDARYISDSETPAYFSSADVCVLPYKSATQSGIVAIAYHFDLPVVATDTGGLSEMILPYGAGLLADKPDAESIEAAVRKFFDRPDADYSANITRAKKDFSWQALAESIIEFSKNLKK